MWTIWKTIKIFTQNPAKFMSMNVYDVSPSSNKLALLSFPTVNKLNFTVGLECMTMCRDPSTSTWGVNSELKELHGHFLQLIYGNWKVASLVLGNVHSIDCLKKECNWTFNYLWLYHVSWWCHELETIWGTFTFSLLLAWTSCPTRSRFVGDSRRHDALVISL